MVRKQIKQSSCFVTADERKTIGEFIP